jgi:cysteine-rich repeat protein
MKLKTMLMVLMILSVLVVLTENTEAGTRYKTISTTGDAACSADTNGFTNCLDSKILKLEGFRLIRQSSLDCSSTVGSGVYKVGCSNTGTTSSTTTTSSGGHNAVCSSNSDCNQGFCCVTGSSSKYNNQCHLTSNLHNGRCMDSAPVECTISGTWSEYGEWSACSKSCDGGFQTQTRTCTESSCGNGCTGSAVFSRQCNTQECTPDPNDGICEDGENPNNAPNDCRTRPSVSSSWSQWCNEIGNCYAQDEECTIPAYGSCGEGWGEGDNYYDTACCKSPPSGVTCGTCVGVATVCGNGIKEIGESCDDDNINSGDGCSSSCNIESGWNCGSGTLSVCTTNCGDGIISGAEACDDGNANGGDGCSSSCNIESGWECSGSTSNCQRFTTEKLASESSNVGGCADLDGDNDVDFEDFFRFSDCLDHKTGPTSDSGACPSIVFHKIDWNDNGIIDVTEIGKDLNEDFVEDFQDFFIFNDCVTTLQQTSTTSITGIPLIGDCTRNALEILDIDNDASITIGEIITWYETGSTSSYGYDLNCFNQQFNQEENLGCGDQICIVSSRGGECSADYNCDPDAIPRLHCSQGETGKFDEKGKFKGYNGICCRVGEVYDESRRECTQGKAGDPCENECQFSPLQAEFYNPNSGCLNLAQQTACVKTKLFSVDTEEREIEILKRG